MRNYAISGLMRAGASRSGFYQPKTILLVNGVDRTSQLWQRTISHDQLPNEQPDTIALTMFDQTGSYAPTPGQTLIVSDGNPTNRFFGGTIVKVTNRSVRSPGGGAPPISLFDVSAIDWTWLLNRRVATGRYPAGTLSSAIFLDLWQRYTTGFTANSVQNGVPTTGIVTIRNEKVSDAFTRLCQSTVPNFHWYVDPDLNLHYFTVETRQRPSSLARGNLTYDGLNYTLDLSQIRTRILCEGGGGATTTPVSAGATTIPVDECGWYQATGGTVITPDGAVVSYTGRSASSGVGNLTGVVGIQNALLQGDAIHVFTIVNDLAAQAALGQLERDQFNQPTDGIHDEVVSNGHHNLEQITQDGLAELAAYSGQNITGSFWSRDRHMSAGKIVTIRLPGRRMTADVTIQQVTRTLMTQNTWQAQVTFAIVWRNLVDVLNRL